MENLEKEISKEEVWNVLDFCTALYGQLSGYNFPLNSDYYNTQIENKLLVDLNNDAQIPNRESLRNAIANYKDNGELLKNYSEFMTVWDSIYAKAIEYKVNLLSFDINKYCINIKDNSEYSSQEYKDDCRRVNKFFQNFKAKQEFRNVLKNILINDVYFTWLRDSSGSFDDDAITLENEDGFNEKRTQSFSLQMLPQKECKITGEFVGKGVKGFLWDFNMDYFINSNVNISNYDPSLIKIYRERVNELSSNNKTIPKGFIIDNNTELNKTNSYNYNPYVRTKVNDGAWCWKYNTNTFNIIPPLTHLLKSVFNNDIIEKLQRDKDIISANAIILGEMKTRDKDNIGNNKNAFVIDPKQVGTLMKLARNGINRNIKQIALPLEETRLYQFADNNSNMYKNQLKSSAGLSSHNGSIVYSDEKLSQEEAQLACTIDFNEVANSIYPQIENFLNFFVNKKTKKYKFRFTVKGSTLPFLRQKDIDNHIKFIDKGIQIPPQRIGTLLGYEAQEFEALMKEAKYGGMQEDVFLLLNTNTNSNSISENIGSPLKDNSDLSEGGAISRDYQ